MCQSKCYEIANDADSGSHNRSDNKTINSFSSYIGLFTQGIHDKSQ